MTPDRDPDRRRPAPPHPGFDQREIDVDMDVCRWCATHVPADEVRRVKHEDWDQRMANRLIQLAERVALLEAALAQLSGAGSRDPSATTADTTAGRASPAPAQDAPTPPPGQHRGGVEGANQGKRPAGNIPPADGALPSVDRGDGPPSPRSTERSRPGGQHPGRGVATPGRELTVDEADQAAYDAWLAAGGRS